MPAEITPKSRRRRSAHDHHRCRLADRSQPASAPALLAADRGVADALESVLSDNTRHVYGAQWRSFNDWCDEVGLQSMLADPLTVARYLAVHAGSGATNATLRPAVSAIAKAHE